MHDDGLDDHPDLINLTLSAKDERAARAAARRAKPTRSPRGPSFFRRHRVPVLAVVVLAVVVTAGSLLVDNSRGDQQPVTPTPRVGTVDLANPFARTPAADFADGAAGIVLPPSAPVGNIPAEVVAAAYENVKRVLVAARLDRTVLEDHDVERYLALLAPDAQKQVRPQFGNPPESYALATRIADGYHLLPVRPKVNGSMSAAVGKDGELRIHTNFVFVYAFQPRGQALSPMEILTVDRFEADFTVLDTRWPAPSRGIWPGTVRSFHYAMACNAHKLGVLAPSYSEPHPPATTGTGGDAAAFDPKQPLPATSTCPT